MGFKNSASAQPYLANLRGGLEALGWIDGRSINLGRRINLWLFKGGAFNQRVVEAVSRLNERPIIFDWHVYDRVRGFLRKRHKAPGRGARQFPRERVYGELGVLLLRRGRDGSPAWAS